MRNNVLDLYESFYFIGVGGVSMSVLCKLLLSLGKKVSGCDLIESEYTTELKSLGVEVVCGDTKTVIDGYDVIVYTDAVKSNNFQLSEGERLNKIILSRGQLLSCVCEKFKRVIAISGCHGKTTTTCMLAHIFKQANVNFTCHIGGNDIEFGNYYNCGYDYFITEACEYKKNFLYLSPNVGVILNSDPDHLECYGNEKNLKSAYVQFAQQSERVISLYGDCYKSGAITFGLDDRADYFAKCIKNCGGKFSFVAYEGEEALGKIELNVYGKHNILNALAAIATSRAFGLSFENIRLGLADFKGVERRFDFIGSFNGATCIADYAHHPNEIKATIKTANALNADRLFVIFQPHTYSRTKNLFAQFVAVLSPLKNLLIYKTFAAREYFDDAGSALTLSQSIKRAHYGDSVQDIECFLSQVKEGDLVLFLGAGDIYFIAKKLIQSHNTKI
jgi:UDP-N-acetylmuramate--alanine ligase